MPSAGHKRIKGSACERAQARERMRTELLAAARAIADESGGFEKVTIRSVADRVGYTAPIVYEYFANKRALLLGLIDVGFTELGDGLGKAQCPSASAEGADGLAGVATAYWEFASDNPHLYRLMHTLPDVPFGTPDAPPAARECFHVLKTAVSAYAPHHPAAAHDDDAPTDLFWAQAHGLVSLTMGARIKGGSARGQKLMTELARTFTAAGAP